MSIDIYCLLTIDLFCPSFIESASKVNVEYCHPWALISCLHDKFKFQSTLQHDVAPNLWKFWPVVSPAHPCLFHLIVSRWGLRIKLCIFTNIWDLIPLCHHKPFGAHPFKSEHLYCTAHTLCVCVSMGWWESFWCLPSMFNSMFACLSSERLSA